MINIGKRDDVIITRDKTVALDGVSFELKVERYRGQLYTTIHAKEIQGKRNTAFGGMLTQKEEN